MNGLIQASNRLNIDFSNCTDYEAASIVARLKYPEPQKYNQNRHNKILARTKHILLQAIVHTEARQPKNMKKGDNNGTI